ncbi:MAG: hypothetical protein ACK56I_26665, partial [bacterium]
QSPGRPNRSLPTTEQPINSFDDWDGSPGHVAELAALEGQHAAYQHMNPGIEAAKRVLFCEDSPPTQVADPWEGVVCTASGVVTADPVAPPSVLNDQPSIDVAPTLILQPSSNDESAGVEVPAVVPPPDPPAQEIELESHSASLPLTAPALSSQPIASQLHPSPPDLFPGDSVEMEVAWARTATQTTVPAAHVNNPVPIRPKVADPTSEGSPAVDPPV